MIFCNRKLIQLLVVLLSFCSAFSQAATEAGKILYARGVVSLVDEQDASRGGETGSVVYEGDRVVTGRGALAQLRLSDGALIALRGSSDYKIEKQSYGEDESLYEQAGKLFTGWMRSITGTIGQKYPQKVSQSTSVATIGIRGTVYQIISIPPEGLPGFAGEEPGTYVMLEQGSVEVAGAEGTRLLKPGDVVFLPASGGAPVLMPEKASLFEDAEARVIEFLDTEAPEFSSEINETLTERLSGIDVTVPDPGPDFTNAAILGRNIDGTYSGPTTSGTYNVTSFTLSGSGADRILTDMSMTVEGDWFYSGLSTTPDATGYHQLAGGDEIIWGVWDVNNYSSDDGLGPTPVTGGSPWLYMLGSNPMDLATVTGLTGTATFNYVGGTGLFGTSNFTNIDSGTIVADFTNDDLVITLNISDAAGVALPISLSNGFAVYDGTRTLANFHNTSLTIIDDPANTFVSGQVSGAFVGGGEGIISSVRIDETSVGTSHGQAAFERQ